MAGGNPMWWIKNSTADGQKTSGAVRNLLTDLTERIRGGDQETLLLLFLLVLLWQDDADKKLLLALGYILL